MVEFGSIHSLVQFTVWFNSQFRRVGFAEKRLNPKYSYPKQVLALVRTF